jgi:hypothetical protein
VNGNHVSGTLVGIAGKPLERVRDEHSVFAAVTVDPATTTTSTPAQPPLQWWCRFTNQKTSSTGTTVGAIRLGG